MTKVIVFGTFDILHPGHLDFFKQAKKFAQKLIVVVARDVNVKKIKHKKPLNNEKDRLKLVSELNVVDNSVLGNLNNPYKIIQKVKPDVICLGYDQKIFTDNLSNNFPKIKIVRLKAYKRNINKSSKFKNLICWI
ncbi:FAD synthase [Patescibacteria group bacterium]|nr:FAD synthase [Patescibacteria group bacterium]